MKDGKKRTPTATGKPVKANVQAAVEAKRKEFEKETALRREASQARMGVFKGLRSQATLKGFDKKVVFSREAKIASIEGGYSIKAGQNEINVSAKADGTFNIFKRLAQGELVDENGTPVVGGAPADQEVPAKAEEPAQAGLDTPAPEAAPDVTGDADIEAPAISEPSGPDDAAKALVTVNDKIAEIEKRDEVDKILKGELSSIRDQLTGVSAALKKMVKPAAIKAAAAAPVDKIGRDEMLTIVAFLGKADEVYKTQMTGFEKKANVADQKGFSHLVASMRSAVDACLEKSHDCLVAYKENKKTASDVRAAVKEVKASLESWQLFKKTTDVFRSEARYAGASKDQLKKVLSATQEMVEAGQLESNSFAAQAMQFLDLNEKEFATVRATLQRKNASLPGTAAESPSRVPSVQTFGGMDSLEGIFDDN